MTSRDYKVWKETRRLTEIAKAQATQSEIEYEDRLIERYYDEHPLDGNAAYARMQGDINPETQEEAEQAAKDYEFYLASY